jgi:quercetin dioxygenase-like cupin family protein
MAIAGETITHPVNGEQITFIRTSADTDGALAELEFRLPAGMTPCPEHVHPKSTETIAVHEGALRVMIDGRLHDVAAGESIALPPGRPHTYIAVGDTRITATYEPAMGMDDFFIDLLAIAEAGDVDDQGVPHHLPLMVLLDDYPDACYLAAPTIAPHKETIRTLACSGRMHGYGRARGGLRIAA